MAKELESKVQARVIRKIKKRLPESIVLMNDSSYLQGIPDLLVLNGPKWGIVEVKAYEDAPYQPNQEHYLHKADGMGAFSATISPENEEEVLDALQSALQLGG